MTSWHTRALKWGSVTTTASSSEDGNGGASDSSTVVPARSMAKSLRLGRSICSFR